MYTYANGNCRISLSADGRKVREWLDEPTPEFPDSIDLKITDRCSVGCPWCHESSSPDGLHAEISRIFEILDDLPPGIEIAIGGGDPLAHPKLRLILQWMESRGLVANMTIHASRLPDLDCRDLIHGLGVSWDGGPLSQLDGRSVVHLIAGIHRVEDAEVLVRDFNLLVLGFKDCGRARSFAPVLGNLARWRYWAGRLMRRADRVLCFDTLAIEQLDIRQWIPDEIWQERYMGRDGEFTMFVDVVRGRFAASSVGDRQPIGGRTIREIFRVVRQEKDSV